MVSIAIRADASNEIGGGHVMRCLTLANVLSSRGSRVFFIMRTAQPAILDMISDNGHRVIFLENNSSSQTGRQNTLQTEEHTPPHAHWLPVHWRIDAGQTLHAIAKAGGADWLIVDHYALDMNWEIMVNEQVKNIMVIDDLADRRHSCDILLDQTLGRQAFSYKKLVPEKTKLLLGTDYALLRSEFGKKRAAALLQRKKIRPVRNIFLSLGASDTLDLIPQVLMAISRGCPGVIIDLAIGTVDPELKYLATLVKKHDGRIRLHGFSTNIADLMIRADLAVGAGGMTSWERCCLGLPTLMLVLAHNQVKLGNALEECGAVHVVQSDKCRDIGYLAETLNLLISTPEILQKMSRAAAGVCDGNGTNRVANTIL